MSTFSDYLENELLDHVFNNSAYTSPTTVYLALYTAAPTDAGGGTEVSGNGYSRQAVTFGTSASGAIANTAAVSFTASGGNWGDILAVGYFDASSAGNFLAWDGTATATVNDGGTLTFPIGDLDITLD